MLVLSVAAADAQQEALTSHVPTNLEVIQRLSRQVVDSIALVVTRGDSVRITIRPAEVVWYVEGAVRQAFRETGRFPTEAPSARWGVELGFVGARVEYSDVRRTGLFESKVSDRTVSVEFVAKVVENSSGEIVASRNISQLVTDVVDVSDIESLENANIPATHGALPKEGFFSTFLEPLIAIGTIAVAVYLLFHVRS